MGSISAENPDDINFMKEAMKQAKKAYETGEVPIGCVIVESATGKIIGRGYNRRNFTPKIFFYMRV